jgi:hypothetical protein
VLAERQQHKLGAGPELATACGLRDGAAQYLARRRRPGDAAQCEVVAASSGIDHGSVEVARAYPVIGQQALDVSTARDRQQEMLGLDLGSAEHPSFVLGKQDEVLGLLTEDPEHQVMFSVLKGCCP